MEKQASETGGLEHNNFEKFYEELKERAIHNHNDCYCVVEHRIKPKFFSDRLKKKFEQNWDIYDDKTKTYEKFLAIFRVLDFELAKKSSISFDGFIRHMKTSGEECFKSSVWLPIERRYIGKLLIKTFCIWSEIDYEFCSSDEN